MQAILSVLVSVLWGSGNFCMGVASKRHSPRLVVMTGFFAGLLGALVYVAISHPVWQLYAVLWGGASGLAQGIGWGLLSYSMSIGRVSIVAPIAAVGSSAFVFLAGVISGDSPSSLAIVGVVVVLLAIVFLTAVGGARDVQPVVVPAVEQTKRKPVPTAASFLALVAAVCFGVQALFLKHVSAAEPSLVMVGARVAVVSLLAMSLIFWPVKTSHSHRNLVPAAIGGVVILLGDIVYLAALHRGPLSVAGVLAGTNPAVTILLAALILREQLRPSQLVGVVLALVGSAMLALG